jgi:hypothetical protein
MQATALTHIVFLQVNNSLQYLLEHVNTFSLPNFLILNAHWGMFWGIQSVENCNTLNVKVVVFQYVKQCDFVRNLEIWYSNVDVSNKVYGVTSLDS